MATIEVKKRKIEIDTTDEDVEMKDEVKHPDMFQRVSIKRATQEDKTLAFAIIKPIRENYLGRALTQYEEIKLTEDIDDFVNEFREIRGVIPFCTDLNEYNIPFLIEGEYEALGLELDVGTNRQLDDEIHQAIISGQNMLSFLQNKLFELRLRAQQLRAQ